MNYIGEDLTEYSQCIYQAPLKTTNTQTDTDRQESNMTMTRKFNIYNGLQGQTKEHQVVYFIAEIVQ